MKKNIFGFLFLNIVLIIGIMYTPYMYNLNNEAHQNLKSDTIVVNTNDYNQIKDDVLEQIIALDEVTNYKLVGDYLYPSLENNDVKFQTNTEYYDPEFMETPTMIKGRLPENEKEVIVSNQLEDLNLEENNKSLVGYKQSDYEIVGVYDTSFVDKSTYTYYDTYSHKEPVKYISINNAIKTMDTNVLEIDDYQLSNLNENIIYQYYWEDSYEIINYDDETGMNVIDFDKLTEEQKSQMYEKDDVDNGLYSFIYLTTTDLDQTLSDIEDIDSSLTTMYKSFDFKDLIPVSFYFKTFAMLLLLNLIVYVPPFYGSKFRRFKIVKK